MRGLGISLVGAALALLACGDAGVAPSQEPHDALEPALVLANMEYAFNEGDGGVLAAGLEDGFLFYFDPNDVGKRAVNGYVMPPSWTRDEFVQVCEAMFAATYSRRLTTSRGSCGQPDEGETTYAATNLKLVLTALYTPVDGVKLESGWCDYDFVRNADSTWVMRAWRDHTYACGCGGPGTSFGRFLAAYASP